MATALFARRLGAWSASRLRPMACLLPTRHLSMSSFGAQPASDPTATLPSSNARAHALRAKTYETRLTLPQITNITPRHAIRNMNRFDDAQGVEKIGRSKFQVSKSHAKAGWWNVGVRWLLLSNAGWWHVGGEMAALE